MSAKTSPDDSQSDEVYDPSRTRDNPEFQLRPGVRVIRHGRPSKHGAPASGRRKPSDVAADAAELHDEALSRTQPKDERDGEKRGSMVEVLTNGPFLRLWLAQAISQTANNTVNFALMLRVRDIVESHNLPQANTAISLVILAFSLPSVLFGPLAGVVADRVNRRTLMAVVNVLRAVTVAIFLFIQPQWQVDTVLLAHYLGTFAFGMAGQFFAPAQGATIPSLVPREQLIHANALFNLTATASQLVGFAALGPILVQLLGVDMLIAVTVPLFVLCAGLVLTIPKTATSPKALAVPGAEIHPMRRVWEEMREGLLYILQDPILLRAIGYLTLASTTFLMVAALGPEFVTGVLGLPKEDIGYIVVPAGIGVLAGVLTVPRLSARWKPHVLIDYALVAAGISLALAATSKDILSLAFDGSVPQWLEVAVTALLLFLAGACNAYVLVPAQTLLQERSHETVRARVYATFFMISNTVSFIPIFFSAAFADLFGVVKVLTVVALILIVLGGSSVIHRLASGQPSEEGTIGNEPLAPSR